MNTYIVLIESPEIRELLSTYGTVGNPNSLHRVVLLTTTATKEEIEALDGVLSVEHETFDAPHTLTKQLAPPSWFLPSSSNTYPDYYYNKTGDGVIIYVMDSGVRFDHSDFVGRLTKTVYTHDDKEWGDGVAGPAHGTMAASCAAGNIHGIAKGAEIRSARYNWSSIEGIKALDTILADYLADDKPAVLSMSFGSYSNVYSYVFDEIAKAGIVMVASAGNYDDPQPMYPARRSDVIAVGAVDKDLKPCVWGGGQASSYGEEVDLWAGGNNGVAAGIRDSFSTQFAGGTSSACPLVAGYVAMLLEGREKLTSYEQVLEVKQQLIDDTRKDVVEYFDDKYNTTPNRYLFTLPNVDVPREDPTPPVDSVEEDIWDDGNEEKENEQEWKLLLALLLLIVGLLVAFM